MLVNVGIDPLKHHRDLNILMTTERTDSLSYAGVRENLVLTLDQVTLNSWNEVMVSRYDGPTPCSTACATTSTTAAGPPATPAGALLLPQPRNSLPGVEESSTPRRTYCCSATTAMCCRYNSTITSWSWYRASHLCRCRPRTP
jgi:hypothetical protein